MALISGVALSHLDLYEKILALMQENGWTLRRGESGEDSGTTSYKNYWCDVRSTGLAGKDTITGHISLHFNTLLDTYYMRFSGSPTFISTVSVSSPEDQPNSSARFNSTSGTASDFLFVPLHRNPIQYWVTCSERRIVGALLFNERWENFYLGLFIPYAFPSQYPYPFFVGGCNKTTGDYKVNTNGCVHGASSVISGALWLPAGSWSRHPTGGSTENCTSSWPYTTSFLPTTFNCGRILPGTVAGVENFAILPSIFVTTRLTPTGTYGMLDGLSFISGWGISAGDIITDSKTNKQHLVVQREKSTANDTCAALLLE